jgi:FixJ family two-component response regulator
VDGIPPNTRILIVDDDEAMRDALEGVLKASGLHSGKFSSAEEFLASPDRQGASCLILDVRLPGMILTERRGHIREPDLRACANWDCIAGIPGRQLC